MKASIKDVVTVTAWALQRRMAHRVTYVFAGDDERLRLVPPKQVYIGAPCECLLPSLLSLPSPSAWIHMLVLCVSRSLALRILSWHLPSDSPRPSFFLAASTDTETRLSELAGDNLLSIHACYDQADALSVSTPSTRQWREFFLSIGVNEGLRFVAKTSTLQVRFVALAPAPAPA